MKKLWFIGLCLLGAAFLPGCFHRAPTVTEAGGRVLLNGQPLPFAQVEFMPQLKDFGAEFNSTGATDAEGRFRLTCSAKNQPGAAVGTHWVLVTEMSPPEEYRTEEGQGRYTAFLQTQVNRPIPPIYGGVATTPLKVEVKQGQKDYDLILTR